MDFDDLRAFLAVAEELHFGRAARRLHVAQPPLSRTIKQLERRLETRLFDRNTRTVALTAAGQALLAPAREALQAVRRAEEAARAAEHGEVGTVRISFAGISTHRLIARIARAVQDRRPGVRLELSSQVFAQPAMKKLLRRDTDIALGRWDVIPAEVATEVVMRDSLVIVLPDTHVLAGRASLSMSELVGESLISLPAHEGAVLAERLRRLARANRFVPQIVQIAPDTQTALALVSAQVGCHLTLESVAGNTREPSLAFVPLRDDVPEVHLRAAWRRGDTDPALRAVVDEMLALARGSENRKIT